MEEIANEEDALAPVLPKTVDGDSGLSVNEKFSTSRHAIRYSEPRIWTLVAPIRIVVSGNSEEGNLGGSPDGRTVFLALSLADVSALRVLVDIQAVPNFCITAFLTEVNAKRALSRK